MIELPPEEIASLAGAEVARRGASGRPERAAVDSRQVGPGDVFFGLRGEHADGGEYARAALMAGAWGVVVEPGRARGLAAELGPAAEDGERSGEAGGWVLSSPDPLASLQGLARGWRRRLGCRVVGITGSVGKTSVKDIAKTILPFRVHASPANFNTEIGLPLAVLAAPPEAEVLALEMAMRGRGQIAELCGIAEPDVGAITNVGPVHLERLGTLEAIAEAKAEVLAGLGERGTAVVPVAAEALEPHLHDRLPTITFGPGGDVSTLTRRASAQATEARIGTPAGEQAFRFPFDEEHNLTNALCAIAIGVALAAPLEEMARRASQIAFSRLRGELVELADEIVLVNDCYNANPVSMRAALDHLSAMDVPGRRLAVLGEMLELGPDAAAYHREVGSYARSAGVERIVGVGELARDYLPDEWAPDASAAVAFVERLLEPGDVVLVKGSRAIGLERLSDELAGRRPAPAASEREG